MLPFNALLKQPELVALKAKTKEAQIAQTIWLNVSPENLAQCSHAYRLKDNQLSVFAVNNAVAAKIKLLIPSLLIKLEKQGCEVTAIRVKVQVKSTPETPTKPVKKLSRHAATELTILAEKLTGTSLGDALARLAKKAN
ncbi:MAG TPA: DciA family protein [Methylophilaceae bacterium]|nr:DciA family protein [Methylophilaceae bacterium]HQC27858.1 DciA family protein [Methylotenera sp.]